MPENALRIATTVLIASLVFGCAGSPSATPPAAASNGSNAQADQAAQETQSRVRYAQSIADYRVCLAANQTNAQACEAKRLTMETNELDLDRLIQR